MVSQDRAEVKYIPLIYVCTATGPTNDRRHGHRPPAG
ncbi:hypothetical protein AK36_1068 [Burkholderia vietnamiensis LMG 10929]|nr:hypothetical protein AK36_1068 [Burkholderia vietnamiensis LMG 10929]